jgi:hypothetical protein
VSAKVVDKDDQNDSITTKSDEQHKDYNDRIDQRGRESSHCT